MSGRTPLRTAAAGTLIAILAVTVLAADQFSKHLVLQSLEPGLPVPVVGEALQFVLVFNPGAAFSLGEGVTWIFTIAMAVVAAIIVYLAATRVRSRLWAVVLGLLLGGVLGNLTDRLFRDPGFAVGHVVDFILTPWMWFWAPNPAIYNVADIFIVGGMAAVALLLVLGLDFDGTRGAGATDGDDTPAAAEPDAASDDVAPATGSDGATDAAPRPSTPDASDSVTTDPAGDRA
ncbi:signal peptidase II [Microbacterium sp. Marseille-Q6965]|uniref:signal peptidase II n=1 Tax=Microbacterium sp. Marseille-Q6965 TaxID=2965072 RepID=UPI0021B7E893|nr:signal peptidase II [Microbacterium sp. Marseille-Q6965]